MEQLIEKKINHDVKPAFTLKGYKSMRHSKEIIILKRGVWLYLILLIFEGALRKWVLPGLSDALLIVRDPLAIVLLIYANIKYVKFANVYTKSITIVTGLCFIAALSFGHKNLIVAIYGCRLTLIHFPLVFLIAKVFNKSDVVQIGKFLLYLCLPMTILVALQFYSPQSAWVNRGIGGNMEGAGFTGSGDYFRPPGTFSFTSGNTAFYSFMLPFILYFLFFNKSIKPLFTYAAIFAYVLAVPLSISRSLFFSTIISILFVLLSLSDNSKKLGRILGAILATGIIVYVLSTLNVFQTSLGAFTDRFTNANENEGGLKGVLLDRFLGGMIGAIQSTGGANSSFFGYGIGFGSNVAAKLVTGSTEVFLVAEDEWARIIGEVGAIFGLFIILIRTNLAFSVLSRSWQMVKKNEVLPWLLCSYSFLVILQGGWAQPANLGFFVVSAGFTLASFKVD